MNKTIGGGGGGGGGGGLGCWGWGWVCEFLFSAIIDIFLLPVASHTSSRGHKSSKNITSSFHLFLNLQ